jgi:hypothetical protein
MSGVLNVGEHHFGSGNGKSDPAAQLHQRMARYHEGKADLEAELKQRFADLAERHQQERDAIQAQYDILFRENARTNGGLR